MNLDTVLLFVLLLPAGLVGNFLPIWIVLLWEKRPMRPFGRAAQQQLTADYAAAVKAQFVKR